MSVAVAEQAVFTANNPPQLKVGNGVSSSRNGGFRAEVVEVLGPNKYRFRVARLQGRPAQIEVIADFATLVSLR